MGEMRERAEAEAINVFARNLKDLLLAAPAGGQIVFAPEAPRAARLLRAPEQKDI